MSSSRGSLEELGRRIERVALDPASIEEQLLFRVARPLLAITGWRAKVRFKALMALFPALDAAAKEGGANRTLAARSAHAAAFAELVSNVESVERAAIVRKKPPFGHAAWLRRVWELLVEADRAIASLDGESPDADALRRTSRADVIGVLPPLALRANAADGESASEDRATREPAAFT
ncbi:MAG TPA: hypothetical protein VLT33_06555, partial [Labilithrix sp.]|nr:hypothetical protein [Labilithrix sp.]